MRIYTVYYVMELKYFKLSSEQYHLFFLELSKKPSPNFKFWYKYGNPSHIVTNEKRFGEWYPDKLTELTQVEFDNFYSKKAGGYQTSGNETLLR